MKFIKNAWTFVKSPLRSAGKKLGCWLVEAQMDEAKATLKNAVAKSGPKAVDAIFDQTQAALEKGINSLPWLPAPWKASMCEVVQVQGNKLQERVKAAVDANDEAAIDAAFDKATVALLKRIQES